MNIRIHVVTGALISFTVGVLCASYSLLSVTVCSVVATLLLHLSRFVSVKVLALVAVMFFAGVLRFELAERTLARVSFEPQQQVYVEGVIIREPETREKDTRFVVELDDGSRVIAYTSLYAAIEYGDRVHATGTFELPENFKTSAGREFQYISYLEKDGITGIVRRAEVTVVAKNQANKLRAALIRVKKFFVAQLTDVLPADEAGIIAGFIIEGRNSVSADIQDMFRRTGLSHTVALSGFNVSIILTQVVAICSLLSRRLALLGGVGATVLFVLMTGGQSTVIRASLMALAALLGTFFRRRYDVSRGLLISAFLMIAWNPYVLCFDFSFQLSFLATYGLIQFSELLYLFFIKILSRFGRLPGYELITSTLSVYLFMTPFLLYTTGTFSVVALPANFLVVPTVPVAMLLGFLTGVFGVVSHTVSQLFVLPLHYLLVFNLKLVSFFSALPFAYYETIRFPGWLCLLSYGFFLGSLAFKERLQNWLQSPTS